MMVTALGKIKMIIEKIKFDKIGKMALILEDGREIIVPLKYFPEIKKLSIDKRKKYTIVDDRTVLFLHSNSIYHLEDFLGLEGMWRER